MAEAVVNPLKMIDIEQNQGPMAVPFKQSAQKCPSVQQPGQGVRIGDRHGMRLRNLGAVACLCEQANAVTDSERTDQCFECQPEQRAVFDQDMVRDNIKGMQHP